MFKIMHRPGADIMLLTGGGIGILYVISKVFKKNETIDYDIIDEDQLEREPKQINIIFPLTAGFIIIGAVFKIMHWPGAVIIIIAGLLIGCFGVVLEMFNGNKKNRNPE